MTNTKKRKTGMDIIFSSGQQESLDLRKNNNIATKAITTTTVADTSSKCKYGEEYPGNFVDNSDNISTSNKRIRVVVADDIIISSLAYVVPPQKEKEEPMMVKKIRIVVDGTTMYSSLPFIANPMGGSQRKVEEKLNNCIFNSNKNNNNYDNVTHQDSTPSSTMLKSRFRRRATKKRKTTCNENVSTKSDDDSDISNGMSNTNNDGNQDNRKRKRSSNKYDTLWNNMLLDLTDYEREFKHTNVPGRYTKNKPLGAWVYKQRLDYKHIEEGKPSPLTQERIHSLNTLGFAWKIYDSLWEDRLQQLAEFNDEFNHTNVPHYYTKNKSLGRWASKQRGFYDKLMKDGTPSSLTQERIHSLNKLGFVWRVGKGTRKATASVESSTTMSLLSSSSDNDNYDDYSNETYTTGNNELCVVSSASATATASATTTASATATASTSLEEEEKAVSVDTVDCASIAVAEEEEDGYESNESELYLII